MAASDPESDHAINVFLTLNLIIRSPFIPPLTSRHLRSRFEFVSLQILILTKS